MAKPSIFVPANLNQRFCVLRWDQVRVHRPRKKSTASVKKIIPFEKKARHYTSRYRGVYKKQPTGNYEAQTRNGKHAISLGCFSKEADAARAFDIMCVWRELHNAESMSNRPINYPRRNYLCMEERLREITFGALVDELRHSKI